MTVVSDVRSNAAEPMEFALGQNYPNPFNPTTTIRYTLSTASFVSLRVFDLLGREVGALVNGERGAGVHSVTWNAGSVAGGVYVYTLRAGGFAESRKLTFQK